MPANCPAAFEILYSSATLQRVLVTYHWEKSLVFGEIQPNPMIAIGASPPRTTELQRERGAVRRKSPRWRLTFLLRNLNGLECEESQQNVEDRRD